MAPLPTTRYTRRCDKEANVVGKSKTIKYNMKKQFLIIFVFLALVSTSSLFGQVPESLTENLVKTLQGKLEATSTKIVNGDYDGAKIDIVSIRDDLKKFEAFKDAAIKDEKEHYEKQISDMNAELRSLKQTVKDLEDKLVAAKIGNETEALKVVEGILAKRNEQQVKIDELKIENTDFKKVQESLVNENTKLKVDLATTQQLNKEYTDKLQLSTSEINKYKSAVKIGLSIGFNSYWNNQKDYIVQKDSTVKEIGNGNGASGIISGVVSIRLSKPDNPIQHNVVINIPLGDFTNNSDRAIGLFNNRIAVGLGYSVAPFEDVPYLSFTGIFNMSPYERLDYETLRSEKVIQPKYTKLKPEDFGATTDISYSFTIGVVYSFINIGKK